MLKAAEVLDHYFLDLRCMLLEIAATLDRHDRAAADGDDPRLSRLYQSLEILADRATPPNRAERLLHLFSDPA